MTANTLFLRLEGPLQAWGDTSKFVIRRTMEAPTKSGVLGMICAAMGLSRRAARDRLQELNRLELGVRIDRPGTRWWDYHTVGAGIGMTKAEGGIKTGAAGTLITRREYLADASFLVALLGDPPLVEEVRAALESPMFPPFLGRKSCPPSRPLLGHLGDFPDLETALQSVEWKARVEGGRESVPKSLEAIVEWRPSDREPEAPADALVWYDVPVSFDPPFHHARFVLRRRFPVQGDGGIAKAEKAWQCSTPRALHPRADYKNQEFTKQREKRLEHDGHLCTFCKSHATTVQHVTYRRAGGGETLDDLRALCRLCHDAVTMIEYGLGMGLDRIDPEDGQWRDAIVRKRDEIIRFRSLTGRRRALSRPRDGRGVPPENEEQEE